jgi:hypothetical protein
MPDKMKSCLYSSSANQFSWKFSVTHVAMPPPTLPYTCIMTYDEQH